MIPTDTPAAGSLPRPAPLWHAGVAAAAERMDLDQLARQGWASVALPAPFSPSDCWVAAAAYFAGIGPDQAAQSHPAAAEVGYRRLPTREMVMLRHPAAPPDLGQAWEHLDGLARAILARVARSVALVDDAFADNLDRVPPSAACPSATVLRLLRYPAQGGIATPAHEDLGLLTVLPRSSVPALQALEVSEGRWRDLELTLRPHEAIAMVGETLSLLTCGRFSACTHRVLGTDGPRFSLAFQVRLRDDAWICTAEWQSARNGPFRAPFTLRGGELLAALRSGRSSVSGSYGAVDPADSLRTGRGPVQPTGLAPPRLH